VYGVLQRAQVISRVAGECVFEDASDRRMRGVASSALRVWSSGLVALGSYGR